MVTPQSRFSDASTSPGALRVADALRRIARDEKLKATFEKDPVFAPLLLRAAQRYTGGTSLTACVDTVKRINAQGHAATADYMGESTREEALACAETTHILQLVHAIQHQRLNCTVSLDLSHIGLVIDPALGLANATKVCTAAAAVGLEVMISMEGSERTDAVLATHGQLCQRFDNVGITVQARLHRTPADLVQLLKRPGRIRLVKGAYEEPAETAHARTSPATGEAYQNLTAALLESGHRCSIGTHDDALLGYAHTLLQKRGTAHHAAAPYEFEVLLGLGPEQSARMRDWGYQTRQYVVYGNEWFMYVCHRIAEHPPRLFDALADVVGIP
jgi:proline dehydrogenase